MRFFRRRWDEDRGDEHADWGVATYYFATDESGTVREQVEAYEDGHVLRYDEARPADELGMLSDQRLELAEMARYEIDEATWRAAVASLRRFVERVLDPGPIPYSQIALSGDPDLEHGLRHFGVEPEATRYRLIELPVAGLTEAASMPIARLEGAIRAGAELPPLVVTENRQEKQA